MELRHVPLDPTAKCADAIEFEANLRSRVVAQNDAVIRVARCVQTYMAGMNDPGRPAGVLLFLGPTGVGKTNIAEAIADVLLGSPDALFKIVCTEFKEGHQVNRLIGAPPGYNGYEENKPGAKLYLTQEKLDKYQKPDMKINVLLIDEIEKAHASLYDMLMNILEKGKLTQSNGAVIDFTRTFIIITSNLGTESINEKPLGFKGQACDFEKLDARIKSVVDSAIERHFKTEFTNRIDEIVIFHTLKPEHIAEMVEIELRKIRRRNMVAEFQTKFGLQLTKAAKSWMVEKGYSKKFGARFLKRHMERVIVQPAAAMMLSGQISLGDQVIIDVQDDKPLYSKLLADEVQKLTDTQFRQVLGY